MSLKNSLIAILGAIILSACTASPYRSINDTDHDPINWIPMYGYPNIEKTEDQKKADERFINTVSESVGSREKASKEFAGRGLYYLQLGDNETSMRRFNQSWLLNPDYYVPYWGFGMLLYKQNKAAEATPHYDKALTLIDDSDNDKPRLLADAAMAYVAHGREIRSTDNVKSEEVFEKARNLANEVFRLDPQFGNEALKLRPQFSGAYYYGAELVQGGLDAANAAHARGDYVTALRQYRLLAEQDVPEAQVSLAAMYRMGQGVQQDYKEAVKWYRMAAEQQYVLAQFNLGQAYYQGRGVQQDHMEAVEWYRRAAEQGYSIAQNNLGFMYYNGLGVLKDNIKAYMWYYIASVSGYSEAFRNRDFVAKNMSPDQIADAHKLAHEWMMKHQ